MSVRRLLALDDDLADKLEEETRRRGVSLEKTVNELLRRSLDRPRPIDSTPARGRFVVDARALHPRPGLNLDDIEGLLDRIDSPEPP